MTDTQDNTTDWKKIVTELNSGMTLQAMGEATGLSLQAIHDLKSGRSPEPRYGAGQTLLRLHARQMAKDRRAAAKGKTNAA